MDGIVIAGAGIGGLTAALCLAEKGFSVTVFEAVPTLKPLGVGINVMPHASGVLHGLGLGPLLDAMAIRTRCVEYRTRFGHVIQSDPRSVEAGFPAPQYSSTGASCSSCSTRRSLRGLARERSSPASR